MRSIRAAAFASCLAIVLGSAPAQTQEADAPAARAGASASAPLYDTEDLLFLRHMSIHHEQAVVMCELVPERTEREAFVRFARYVKRAQSAEIEQMNALLDLAAERGLEIPEHGPHGDPPMAGMLSSSEMNALEASSGAEFERRWLEGMIFHHEGGLAMARAQQLKQLERSRRPYGFHVLVEDILVEQRAEITKMNGWLREWGLVDESAEADTRAPAAGVTSPTPGATVESDAPLTLLGTAIDDVDVERVNVAIEDLESGRSWHADGAWGERAWHRVETTRSGPSSVAWRFEWTPPAPGRYGIRVRALDTAGERAVADMLRAFEAR